MFGLLSLLNEIDVLRETVLDTACVARRILFTLMEETIDNFFHKTEVKGIETKQSA